MFLPVYAYNRVGESGVGSDAKPSRRSPSAAPSGATPGTARDLLALATMPRV